ncbi:MAG: CDP-alcohol phosphatidyltransferase family protein [Candidatus Nitrohelix vancouverensis]|uniref:CDP-alcohol phosphatidyltransferase family protein n=1 Tax=Candidatus Nitrohelix vancouverensis TaxID=2705534 RepID=A0A7T0C2F9_9BACT|nr:MAG: CDP-alcohol phosphatidyltransferase family protein [Candidatus Nitrohelix vancouverensis]
MNKLPPEDRFFDVNDLWYFWNVWVVRILYRAPVTANQITGLTLVLGLASAACFLWDDPNALLWAGALLYGKIFFDNVDGNLARARKEETRLGRFFDSLTDFLSSVLVYLAAAWRLYDSTGQWEWLALGAFALVSCLLQCSYFVFYLVQYTSISGSYRKNRVDESVTKADIRAVEAGASPFILFLQRMHVFFYGWQDKSILWLDRVVRSRVGAQEGDPDWYQDKRFMTLVSPLCVCTCNMVLVVFALADRLDLLFLVYAPLSIVYWFGLIVWQCRRYTTQRIARTECP